MDRRDQTASTRSLRSLQKLKTSSPRSLHPLQPSIPRVYLYSRDSTRATSALRIRCIFQMSMQQTRSRKSLDPGASPAHRLSPWKIICSSSLTRMCPFQNVENTSRKRKRCKNSPMILMCKLAKRMSAACADCAMAVCTVLHSLRLSSTSIPSIWLSDQVSISIRRAHASQTEPLVLT